MQKNFSQGENFISDSDDLEKIILKASKNRKPRQFPCKVSQILIKKIKLF